MNDWQKSAPAETGAMGHSREEECGIAMPCTDAEYLSAALNATLPRPQHYLLIMLVHVSTNGVWSDGFVSLSKRLRLSRGTVKAAVKRLEEAGYLRVVHGLRNSDPAEIRLTPPETWK